MPETVYGAIMIGWVLGLFLVFRGCTHEHDLERLKSQVELMRDTHLKGVEERMEKRIDRLEKSADDRVLRLEQRMWDVKMSTR